MEDRQLTREQVIKQDLAQLTQALAQLREVSRKEHPKAWVKGPHAAVDQEGEHGKNVVVMLSGRLENMTDSLKGVLRTRMDNMLSSKARTEKFVSNVSQYSQNLLDPSRSDSPLYNNNNNSSSSRAAQQDTLSLEPAGSSETQMLMMEEAQDHNPYIRQRGEAIEMIERTMNELGGMFSQLAQMVHEQGEQIRQVTRNLLKDKTYANCVQPDRRKRRGSNGQRRRRAKRAPQVLESRVGQSDADSEDVWSFDDM